MDIFIETEEDLTAFLKEYGVESLDELSSKYHKLTGGEIIDRREDSEYTNVNAQRDPDFFELYSEGEL